jgi:2,4-dienoyl-CoA reductase-like NADH-dependent reductase (Old Yellow Enzyme family)
MDHLFSPFTLREITIRNRIGLSPMCQYSYEDGFSNDWQLVHLGTRATGGAGLILTEATAVEARGRISPYDLGIWKDDHIKPLRKVTNFIKSQGAIAGIQLAHAGRKACTMRPWDGGNPVSESSDFFWRAVSPVSIPFSPGHQIPEQLDIPEIKVIQSAFQAAAQRALEAGFEWLELHAAHGYLIHSFYSPLSNFRTDQYGGDFENRIRFLIETIHSVQEVWPVSLPLTVRISGSDWVPGGWTIDDSVRLGKVLKTVGVDLVDCSSGGNVRKADIPFSPGYQLPISEAVRRNCEIPTAAVGLITEASQANDIIQSGKADLVLLGREMLRNPYWAIKATKTLGEALPVPPQYLRAY